LALQYDQYPFMSSRPNPHPSRMWGYDLSVYNPHMTSMVWGIIWRTGGGEPGNKPSLDGASL
jgi:hypothetical protein